MKLFSFARFNEAVGLYPNAPISLKCF